MPNESVFTGSNNPLLPDVSAWSSQDTKSSENEVNEFIYSLVRMIKPHIVVETGCYLGEATFQIADALVRNGFGKLITCDTDEKCIKIVEDEIEKSNYPIGLIFPYVMIGENVINTLSDPIDFAFIDSSGNGAIREQEIEALIPKLSRFGMFLLHDTAPQHKTIREAGERIKKKYNLSAIYFNTPRGLSLYQKLDDQI